MSIFAKCAVAIAAMIAASSAAQAAQAAQRPVEQLYAECHKRIVTPKGKFREGDPKTETAIEDCIRKRMTLKHR
jgi:hypothetical protein